MTRRRRLAGVLTAGEIDSIRRPAHNVPVVGRLAALALPQEFRQCRTRPETVLLACRPGLGGSLLSGGGVQEARAAIRNLLSVTHPRHTRGLG